MAQGVCTYMLWLSTDGVRCLWELELCCSTEPDHHDDDRHQNFGSTPFYNVRSGTIGVNQRKWMSLKVPLKSEHKERVALINHFKSVVHFYVVLRRFFTLELVTGETEVEKSGPRLRLGSPGCRESIIRQKTDSHHDSKIHVMIQRFISWFKDSYHDSKIHIMIQIFI